MSLFRRTRSARAATAASTTPATPLSAVADAIADGAAGRGDIARRTGLNPGTVDAAIDHLERTGRLRREHMASSCSAGGCGSCPVNHGGAECAGPGRGPVALVLSPTRRS